MRKGRLVAKRGLSQWPFKCELFRNHIRTIISSIASAAKKIVKFLNSF